MDVRRNSYVDSLGAIQTSAYILRAISDGMNENQIVERFDGDRKLVRIWIETLNQIRLIAKNSFDELVITPDGENYLREFDSNR